MSLWDRAKEFEDMSDSQIAQIIQQGGEKSGDILLAGTEAQRRADIRARYEAQLEKHQAAQQASGDVLSQRAQELTERGGGITGVDPGMALSDPSLQTGIAAPPSVAPMGQARGGLIRGYQTGDLVDDPPWWRTDPFAIDELPMAEDMTRAEYDRLSGTVPGTQITKGQALIDAKRKAEEGSNWAKVGRWITDNIPWTGTARELAKERDYLQSQGYSADEVLSRLKGKKDAIYEGHREERIEGLEGRLSPGDLAYLDMQGEQEEDDGSITLPSGRIISREEREEAAHEYHNLDKLREMKAEALAMGDREGAEQIQKGIDDLVRVGRITAEEAEAEGAPDDWMRALMEGQQAHREGMYETGRSDVQRVEDAILTRGPLDEAHNLLREREADLLEQQLGDKGIRGLTERDRLQEFAESRQELSGKSVQDYKDLREWDRERIDNLRQGTGMLVSTDFDDEYLKDIHTALGDISTESTGIEHTALGDIISQLEEGKTWEKEDFGEVYTQSEAAQKDIDKARSDRLGFDVTRADEEANRKRLTLERLLKDRLGLVERGMQEEGATSRARMQIEGNRRNAETVARTNLKNYAADPSKWTDIETLFNDVINSFDRDDPMAERLATVLQEVGVGMASSLAEGQRGNLPTESQSIESRRGITSQAQADALIEAITSVGGLERIPEEVLARILAGG